MTAARAQRQAEPATIEEAEPAPVEPEQPPQQILTETHVWYNGGLWPANAHDTLVKGFDRARQVYLLENVYGRKAEAILQELRPL